MSHGWHTGVVVRGRDLVERLPGLGTTFDAAGLLELGWGDAAFYRAPEPSMSLALSAALYPTDTVLHVVAMPDGNPQAALPGGQRLAVTVPSAGYERLLDYLAATFTLAPDGTPLALEPGLYGKSRFFRAEGRFHALNTCNTWVARAVAATGYPLPDVEPVTAGSLLQGLRRDTGRPCYAATPRR